MRERRASEFAVAELAEFWNQGYAGYFVPLNFSEEQMAAHLRCGDVDLDGSRVWMDGAACVGFSYLGVRGERGWIGGFGVTPAYRGRGLSYELFARHLETIRQGGPPRVQLEVLEENWARRVYERAGMAVTRRVVILQGTLPDRPDSLPSPSGVWDADPRALLAHHERLHAALPPTWNRERPWLERSLAQGDAALAVGPEDAPTAVLWFRDAGGSPRILDAAAVDRAAADALARGLAARVPGAAATLVNEPERSPVRDALEALGLAETRAQWEMHLPR